MNDEREDVGESAPRPSSLSNYMTAAVIGLGVLVLLFWAINL